jgi:ribose 5-phosphate isomerase B
MNMPYLWSGKSEDTMQIGIAADHGGLELKNWLAKVLQDQGHEVRDFGAHEMNPDDDFPDFILPLAESLSRKKIERGIAVCGSGVGACVAANKVNGVRACLIHESFSAHQGVEDDDMNMICLGGRVVGNSMALELVRIFLDSRFKRSERFLRRIGKIEQIEKHWGKGR